MGGKATRSFAHDEKRSDGPAAETRQKKRNSTYLAGLVNFGNTCYFNAVISALASSKDFRERLAMQPVDRRKGDSLTRELQAFFRELAATRRNSLSPNALFQALNKLRPEWTTSQQQDAHELLNYILNYLETPNTTAPVEAGEQWLFLPPCEVNQKEILFRRSSSHLQATGVAKLFEGYVAQLTRCLACDTPSSRLERFYDLPLDMSPSLQAAISSLENREFLSAQEKFSCCRCHSRQPAVRSTIIKTIPQVLVFQLKRFAYDARSNLLMKRHDIMPFELQLKITRPGRSATVSDNRFALGETVARVQPFLVGTFPAKMAAAEERTALLQLFAVICHIGSSLYTGHYITIVRQSLPHEHAGVFRSADWCVIDDDMVTPLSSRQVADFCGGKSVAPTGTNLTYLQHVLDCRNAYILFYERLT